MEQNLPPASAEAPHPRDDSAAGTGNPENPDQLIDAGEISAELARFSRLSSDLTDFLSVLSRKIKGWLDQLGDIQSQIDFKKKELKRLHDIEVSAAALEQLIEDQRLRKESFESFMESERIRCEEEKARRTQEEEQYLVNLRTQRQREEEEHKQKAAAEEQQARQRLEEELGALREENRLQLEAREKHFAQRELILREKELEWTRLVEELEQFMSRLANHAQSRTASHKPDND
jgi:hypothetical protein